MKSYSWFFSGDEYHAIRDEWKKNRESLANLSFAGFAAMAWYDEEQRIELKVNKDENDVTQDVTVNWKGREDTKLLRWMRKEWKAWSLDRCTDDRTKRKRKLLRDVENFKIKTEQVVKHMEDRNVPLQFIKCYRHDRELWEGVLRARYHYEIGLYDDKDVEAAKKRAQMRCLGKGELIHL